jgi:hypothetical protein
MGRLMAARPARYAPISRNLSTTFVEEAVKELKRQIEGRGDRTFWPSDFLCRDTLIRQYIGIYVHESQLNSFS